MATVVMGALALLAAVPGCTPATLAPSVDTPPTAAVASSPAPPGCFGVGDQPAVDGVPSAGYGAQLAIDTGSNSYTVRVGPAEESQHSDLPPGSDQEILVLPVAVAVTNGSAVVDEDTFEVYDAAGRRCIVPEDQVGYPLLPSISQRAGMAVEGTVGVLAMRNTRSFTVVQVVAGEPVAVWR